MAHKQWLTSMRAVRLLIPLARPAFWASLVIAVTINVLLLTFFYSVPRYV